MPDGDAAVGDGLGMEALELAFWGADRRAARG